MKKCCECKKTLEFKEFNKSSSTKDGHQNWCRPCQKLKYSEYRKSHPEITGARWKRYYQRHKDRMIKRTRSYEKSLGEEEYIKRWKTYNKNSKFTRYGLSESEYNQMLKEQEQKCGMCEKLFDKNKPRSIHIDHDHATGQVRGILCDRCNLFLGVFESDKFQKKISRVQAYLRKTEKREIKNSR